MERIQAYRAEEVSRVLGENVGLLLLHFGSPLASSCDFVRKELQLLVPRFEGPIQIGEVELPLQDLQLIQDYEIEQIPTLILFDGCVEVERLERILLPEELREFLEAAISFYAPQAADSE